MIKISNNWTKQEIEQLKNVYPFLAKEKLLKLFARHTIASIWNKAYELGLHRGHAGPNNGFFGKKHKIDSRIKMSSWRKGKKPWNYGIPMSDEQKIKVSVNRKGKGKGKIPWNRGIPTTAAVKLKISLKNTGRKHTDIELDKMRKCQLDEHAFDIVNEESAYWMGILMTDGNVCHKKDKRGRITGHVISLSLQEDDLAHLKAFQKFIGSSHTLHHRINLKTIVPSKSYELSFSSIRMASSLARFGFVSNKSRIAKVKLLEDNRDFWRGTVDGDGTISIDSLGRPWMKLIGSFEMILQFKEFLERNLDMKMPQVYNEIYDGGSIDRIVISCNTCIRVLKLLYDNSSVYLERKFRRAQHLIERGYDVRKARRSTEDELRMCILKKTAGILSKSG